MSANSKAKARAQAAPAWRLHLVLALLLAAALLLAFRVASLQVVDTERGRQFLQGQGNARTIRTETIPAHRGRILDRHGEPLAVSTPVVSLWAHPGELAAAPEQWPALAEALGWSPAALRQRLQRHAGREFMYLRRHLPPAQAEAILAQRIPGVNSLREYRRFYPAGEVAAHIVGFTDIDDRGQEGLELAYDEWLQGRPGHKRVLRDLRGNAIRDIDEGLPAQAGRDLRLSIDLRLQYLAYRELKATLQRTRAKSGSVVVLDSHTGEILAMVNQPSFNPNNRAQLQPGVQRNRAVTDLIEPGSTVKPLTVLAALESGRFGSGSVIDTAPGHIRVGGKVLLDPVNYGEMDLTAIIAKSSQVGLTRLAMELPPESIWEVYYRFGLGMAPETGFPGEQSGVMLNRQRWHPIEHANFSFGYGLSVTPLQLARAYSVFATEGVQRPASLLQVPEPPAGERVAEAALARQVIDMMRAVTEPGGTGTQAQVPAYSVAGKTGTVHKVGAGGYDVDRYTAVFAGIAPATQPRITAVVVIDEPAGRQYFGGQVAAPVFSRVVEGAMRLLHIPPDQQRPDQQRPDQKQMAEREPRERGAA